MLALTAPCDKLAPERVTWGYCAVGQDLPSILPEGTVLAGKFRVVRQLGEGGMGSVYEVEHELTRHRRALKLLHEGFAERPDIVARFLREASAAGRIGNPHIVETFDAGRLEGGEPYIVMELLEGTPMSDLIEQRGRLDFEEAIELILQAANGVQAAHEAGIIHRDLKPENVFVCSGPTPFVKILDFGISKFDPEKTGDSALTVDGTTMGTPTHMAPEQIRGQTDIDARADVYALGLVLYECVTGRKAYFADTLPQLAIRIHEGNYTPVSHCRTDTPRGFDELMQGALVADRDRRYPTMAAFIQAVGAFLRQEGRPGASVTGQPPAPLPSDPRQLASGLSHPAPAPLQSAATDAGVATEKAAQPRQRVVAVLAVAVLALVSLGVVAFKFLGGDELEAQVGAVGSAALPEAAASTRDPAASHEPPPQAEHAKPVQPSPSVESQAKPQSSAAATARTRGATPTPAKGAAAPTPVASGSERAASGKSRASQVGLAEDNPF